MAIKSRTALYAMKESFENDLMALLYPFLGVNTQHVIKSESPLVADAVTLQRLTNTEFKTQKIGEPATSVQHHTILLWCQNIWLEALAALTHPNNG